MSARPSAPAQAPAPQPPAPKALTIGVLALQGSFPLHLGALAALGIAAQEVRRPEELRDLAGLIVPGGESTTMERLARSNGLFEAIQSAGSEGLPILGTCAGAILLGRGEGIPRRWALADVEVERNAYGRQLASFTADVELRWSDDSAGEPFHAVFIRAPKMHLPPGFRGKVLGTHDGVPVLVEDRRFLLASFHPELTDDLRVHAHFVQLCGEPSKPSK